MLQILDKTLETINRQAGGGLSKPVDLLVGMKTHALFVEVEAVVDISGGTTSGTPTAEGLSRLIDQVRIRENGETTVDLDGRLLQYLTDRGLASAATFDSLATGDVQTTTLRGNYVLSFASIFGADPSETAYIARNSRFPLQFDVNFTSDVAGALIAGGDRVVAVTSMTVRVTQQYDPISTKAPFFVPRIQRIGSNAFVGAVNNFPVLIYPEGGHRVQGVVAHGLSDGVTAAMLTGDVSFRGDSQRYVDEVPFRTVLNELRRYFPGLTPQAGYLDLNFRRYGKLSECFLAGQDQNPRLVLDVNGGGTVNTFEVATLELAVLDGITRPLPPGW